MPRNLLDGDQPNRRQLVKILGATSVAGLAGCSGDGDGGGDGSDGGSGSDGEMGERVEEVVVSWWPDFPGITEIMENSMPTIMNTLEELGMTPESRSVNYAANLSANDSDERTNSISLITYTTTMDRLDPQYMIENWLADRASTPGGNHAHYVNCEHTDLVYDSTQYLDEERRREVVNESQRIFSEDVPIISVTPRPAIGLIRTDLVEPNNLGVGGLTVANAIPYIYCTPREGDQLVSARQQDLVETRNYPIIQNGFASVIWNILVHSPLLEFDENFELRNVIAGEISPSDDGTEVRVELRDATFHNGDPITAEDVQFTFEYWWEHTGVFPQTQDVPSESIDIIDDQTLNFVFERPYAPLLSRIWPSIGIMHKQTWVDAGAWDDPEGVNPDPLVGSGPFEISDFQAGQYMTLTPHDGNPVHSPDHEVVMEAYQDATTAYRAFQQGQVHTLPDVPASITGRAESDLGDDALVTTAEGTMPFALVTKNHFGPTKFRAVRMAIGMALNREEIVDQSFRGQTEPELHCRTLLDAHPYTTPTDMCVQYTDDPSGDIEGARQVLEDAGFSWDDDGNLRYPPDADLSPMWEQGATPGSIADQFPCLDADSNYVSPEQR